MASITVCGEVIELITQDEPIATILYTDGTLVINDTARGKARNENLHGAVVEEYPILDSINPYVFGSASDQPWSSKRSLVTALEFGSEVAPESISFWFQNCTNLASISWTNFDGINTLSARAFVPNTAITTFTLPQMPNLETIQYICNGCPNLTRVDMSDVASSAINNMATAFQGCYALTEVDISGFAGSILNSQNTFSNVSGGGDMALTTIYVNPDITFANATNSTSMFRGCTNLVGGAGTIFDSNYTNKAYARIDNPPSEPGYFTSAYPVPATTFTVNVYYPGQSGANLVTTVTYDCNGRNAFEKFGCPVSSWVVGVGESPDVSQGIVGYWDEEESPSYPDSHTYIQDFMQTPGVAGNVPIVCGGTYYIMES